MPRKSARAVLLACLAFAGVPLAAHHSFAAEFDANKRVTLKGVVTRVEWTNPHTYFYVDVRGEGGTVVNWAFETAGPNTLSRQGWSRRSLKIGDQVTVVGYQARDGLPIASAREVVLSDGHRIFTGSTVDGGPTR